MGTNLLDSDVILSCSEQWTRLDQIWGTPIDLETDEDAAPSPLQPVFSTMDLRRPTFDSKLYFKKKPKQKILSPTLEYKDFKQELDKNSDVTSEKQFYFIGGQIYSSASINEICDDIDDIFKSVDKLYTSTVRQTTPKHKPNVKEIIKCSISATDLSFDETEESRYTDYCNEKSYVKEKSDSDDVDRFIDELFDRLNHTMASLQRSAYARSSENIEESITRESVTTLVKKFTKILENPILKRSPRRKKECCDKFRDLAEFWKSRTLFKGE